MRSRIERRLHAVTAILFAVALVRTLLFVTHLPVYGYANNYDFIRVSSWFHLWPDPRPAPPGFDPLAQHPEAPIRCYAIQPALAPNIFYPTSDLIFVGLGVHTARALAAVGLAGECEVDVRAVGLVRAAFMLGLAAAATIMFARRSARAGLASAAFATLVLSDAALLLLYNTLYSEFACVFFAYAAAVVISYSIAFRSYGLLPCLAIALSFVGLGTSKTQYAGLPVVLAGLLLVAGLASLRRQRKRASFFLSVSFLGACSLLVLAAQQRTISGGGSMWSMRMGAATDAFFGAILPSMSEPAEGLALLGLPARCAPYVGKTWYDEGMQPPPCPEIGGVPRRYIVRLLWHDPALGARLIEQAAPLLQPMIVRYYGQIEGEQSEQADLRLASGAASVSRLVEALSTNVFLCLLVLTVVMGGVAALDLARLGSSDPSVRLLLPATILVAATIELYSFSAALIGAGFVDLGRHSLVGQLAFLYLLGAGPFEFARAVAGTPGPNPVRRETANR